MRWAVGVEAKRRWRRHAGHASGARHFGNPLAGVWLDHPATHRDQMGLYARPRRNGAATPARQRVTVTLLTTERP